MLSLANTKRTLAKRAQELNNSQDAKKYTQDALAHYQNAAATATSAIARTQAQLNQLSLLIETNQSTSAQSLLPQIAEALSTLPSSRASVYAHVNLAQSLMKMGNREWRMGNGEKAVPNPQDIAQILDRAIQQAKSLKDQRAESKA